MKNAEQSVQPEPPFTVFEMDIGFAAAPVNAVVTLQCHSGREAVVDRFPRRSDNFHGWILVGE